MSGTMSLVWQHPLPWLIHLFCVCPCKLDKRQRLHNMLMAMCKQGLHKDQSEAFWRKTDYTTNEDSGIQEGERDRCNRETTHSESEVKPEPHCHTEEERRWSMNWWEMTSHHRIFHHDSFEANIYVPFKGHWSVRDMNLNSIYLQRYIMSHFALL